MQLFGKIMILLVASLLLCSSAFTQDGPPPSGDSIQVTLSWTNTGNDQLRGRASYLDIRYSNVYPFVWGNASGLIEEPVPDSSGMYQEWTLWVPLDSVYYFGMKVGDSSSNWSDVSNIVELRPIYPPLFVTWR